MLTTIDGKKWYVKFYNHLFPGFNSDLHTVQEYFGYEFVCQVPFKMYLEAILAKVKLLEAEDGLCLPTSGSILVCASLHRSEVQSANKV
jgi:hypothetical protein